MTATLGQTYNQGDGFRFDVYYHGHPVEGGFQAFSFDVRNGNKVMASLSEPYYAPTWWPCKESTVDKADSFDIAIEVDTAFYCGSNGKLVATTPNGGNSHTFHYTVRYPMVTYLFSVAISKYTVWNDKWVYNGGLDTMLITNAVYPASYAGSLANYSLTPSMLTYLSQAFGQYPYVNEKYGHSHFEWGGGMEHQTMTSMVGYSSFGWNENVIVHEMGHQWWGDMITCAGWPHIWLNEGWASYAEAWYHQLKDGWPTYFTYMNSMNFTGGGTIYQYDTTNVNTLFGTIVYDKGAWVLHMLRGVLGETKWRQAVDAWYSSPYKFGSATTEQFRDVVEQATGEELDWFFQEWIYGTYRPDYTYMSYTEAAGGGKYNLYVVIRQTHMTSPLVFTMPIDIFVNYTTLPDDTVIVFNNARQQFFKFQLNGAVSSIDLDPAGWILKNKGSAAWELFLVTLPSEVKSGEVGMAYNDTIGYRGGSASGQTLTMPQGSLPPGLGITNKGVITGTPTTEGTYNFMVKVKDNLVNTWTDSANYSITIAPFAGVPGDVNHLDNNVDIADLTLLIENLFITFTPLPVPKLADVDNNCSIDINDLTALISFLFLSGPDLVMGCAE